MKLFASRKVKNTRFVKMEPLRARLAFQEIDLSQILVLMELSLGLFLRVSF